MSRPGIASRGKANLLQALPVLDRRDILLIVFVVVQAVLANGEWLGKRVEQEIDWARRDQRDDLFRDGAGRPN